ncbi:ATP-binding protein [Sediminitomix flava]|uniref:histidine kinase n=1 Tax=Sediminitomix flava TaxID=379075 RepID=A0A315ZJI7_SEDFL|nr:HAMP domain-containing sensor histidine kinase [Sediminitomix flava]PWJ44854.1 signal transduction histidine kinase [Sediminitomix flava]
MRKKSINIQLLLAFSSFTILISTVSVFSFYLLNKSEHLNVAKSWLYRIDINISYYFQNDARALYADFNSTNLDRKSRLRFLNERKTHLQEIKVKLEGLEQTIMHDDEIIDLYEVDSLINVYDSAYLNLFNKHLQRGDSQNGLKGNLFLQHKKISTLKGEIPTKLHQELIDLFYALNTNEKKELIIFAHLDQVKMSVNHFLETNPESKAKIGHQLISFVENASEYFELNRELGEYETPGQIQYVENLRYFINSSFDKINTLFESKIHNSYDQITRAFNYLLGSSILISVLMTFFLTRYLSNPITSLTRKIKEITEQGSYDKLQLIEGGKHNKNTEVLTLAINSLFRKIYVQVTEIRKQHHRLVTHNNVLKSVNLQLLQSEKAHKESNTLKTKLFSIISHDLKGPLSAQKGFFKIMSDHADAFTQEEIQQLSKEMLLSTENISNLLENLLAWSRSQMDHVVVNPELINLSEAFDTTLELLSPQLQSKNIEVHFNVSTELEVYADPDMLNFIIRNLVSNAIKFTNSKGEIFIFARTKDEVLTEINIEDNGIGMSEDEAETIFSSDKTFTKSGTAQEKGTGIGLMLSHEFILRNHGKIELRSIEGEGTTFILQLPNHALEPAKTTENSEKV